MITLLKLRNFTLQSGEASGNKSSCSMMMQHIGPGGRVMWGLNLPSCVFFFKASHITKTDQL